jgi:hypothetical protein
MKTARAVAGSLIIYSARRQTPKRVLGLSYLVFRFLLRRLKTKNKTILKFKVEPGSRYEIIGLRRGV